MDKIKGILKKNTLTTFVYLFGSRVRELAGRRSDCDIVICFNEVTKDGEDSILKRIFILLSLILIISGCKDMKTPKTVSLEKKSPPAAQRLKNTEDNTLYFGFDLRLGPKEDVRIYSSFLRYLEGITGYHFRIHFTMRYEDTIDNLKNGITHFAAIGPLSYVVGKEKDGIKCLASGLNEEDKPEYRAVIFTRPDSDIMDLKDLKGRNFAFGSRYSTQGHLIPRKMLEDAGLTLKDLKYYIYTGSHINTVRAVLNGDADAGGTQDILAKRLERDGKIKIVGTSEPFPSSLICYNSAVNEDVVNRVRSALLYLDPIGIHKKELLDWDKTEMPNGFTRFDESRYNVVRVLAKRYKLLSHEVKH